jgi:hypothetical protein
MDSGFQINIWDSEKRLYLKTNIITIYDQERALVT